MVEKLWKVEKGGRRGTTDKIFAGRRSESTLLRKVGCTEHSVNVVVGVASIRVSLAVKTGEEWRKLGDSFSRLAGLASLSVTRW